MFVLLQIFLPISTQPILTSVVSTFTRGRTTGVSLRLTRPGSLETTPTGAHQELSISSTDGWFLGDILTPSETIRSPMKVICRICRTWPFSIPGRSSDEHPISGIIPIRAESRVVLTMSRFLSDTNQVSAFQTGVRYSRYPN